MFYGKDLPGIIDFGIGCRNKLPELLPEGNVLIVAGKHSFERIEKELLVKLSSRQVAFAPPVSAELPLSSAAAAIACGREIRAKTVIGWGGGSAMDCAKTVAALLYAPEDLKEYFYQRAVPPERKTFLVLLPTTAGTGAEITANAVLCDPETGIKQSLRTPGMSADAALIDPELLYDSPPEVISASGFDALTQALESFTSLKADSLTRQIASIAAELLLKNLLSAYNLDHTALQSVARGSMLAGIAFASSGLGAVHGIGHPLGSVMNLSHGKACALLLPEIMKWNREYCPEIFDSLAQNLGFTSANELIYAVENLRKKLHLPEKISQSPLTPEKLDFIVANCRSGSMKCNPRTLSDNDVRNIVENLL